MSGVFKELFASRDRSAEPTWLAQRRGAAMDSFDALGLPTTRLEAWKYTSLRGLDKLTFGGDAGGQIAPEAAAQLDYKDLDVFKVTFVDGRLDPALTDLDGLPEGLVVEPMAAAIARKDAAVERHFGAVAGQDRAFVLLNEALFTDGILIKVPRNMVVEKPIHMVCISTERAADQSAGSSHTRNLIVAEQGSQATILETWAGPASGPVLTSAVTEVHVGDNAELKMVRLQDAGPGTYGVHHLDATVGRDARFRAFTIDLGGALVRNETRVLMEGPNSESDLGGLYPLTGTQHVDNFTLVDHRAPNCNSRQLFKGLLHDKSRSVFQGKVHVRREAQKTNAEQSNRNIVLSPGAIADTKPMLEIYADDVRCTHGATVGQLDENPELIFYLRSRGITPDHARWLLTRAFAQEVVHRITEITGSESIEARLEALVAARLERMTVD